MCLAHVGFNKSVFGSSTLNGVTQPLTKTPRPLNRRRVFSLMPASGVVSSERQGKLAFRRDQYELQITGQSQLVTEQRTTLVHHFQFEKFLAGMEKDPIGLMRL